MSSELSNIHACAVILLAYSLCSLQSANNIFLSHQTSTSHQLLATSQPAVFFSHNKSAPATSRSQPNRVLYAGLS